MKKLIVCAALVIAALLAGCNKQVIDLTYAYDWAEIKIPDETIVSGAVESWKDYGDGDQLQVKIDGVTYLVHSSQVVLTAGNGGKNAGA